MSAEPLGPVIALVPAWERADSVGDTVRALRADARVHRVVVVDDGSRDATAEAAARAGAEVIRLATNRGKGGAVAAGLDATGEAGVYLLVDADVGATATAAVDLVAPVLDGRADLVIGTLPGAGGQGGFGMVRRLAASGIRRGSGASVSAPLSGQRAVRAELLRGLCLAPRFGLETAMTLDAARAGARILEMPVAMAHRATGRGPAGFAHRARQGGDVVRALWPRLTTARTRMSIIAIAVLVALGVAGWSGSYSTVPSAPLSPRVAHVVVVGVANLGLDQPGAERARRPALQRLLRQGAVGALNVRTLSRHPSEAEAWTSLGAGARTVAGAAADLVYPANQTLEGGTAAEALARRLGPGVAPGGFGGAGIGGLGPKALAVVGAPAVARANGGRHLTSSPGALGEALHGSGRLTAAIGRSRAALAVMDGRGIVDEGDSTSPIVAAVEAAVARADVVAVGLDGDSGRSDPALGAIADLVERRGDTLMLALGVTPETREWRLTPVVAVGPGVRPGWLTSPSTRKLGLVVLTDIAPTVAGALGVAAPVALVGHPLRVHADPDPGELGRAERRLAALVRLDRGAARRARSYLRIVVPFVVLQGLLYLGGLAWSARRGAFGQEGGRLGRSGPGLAWAGVGIATFPLATLVTRAMFPGGLSTGTGAVAVVGADLAILFVLSRGRRASPGRALGLLTALTASALILDILSGSRLEMGGILGYAPQSAARYYGIGNAALAVLTTTALLAAAHHVQRAPRHAEALLAAVGGLAVTAVVAAAPTLGANAGGALVLAPVAGVMALAMTAGSTSRRATRRARRVVLAAVVAMGAAAAALAAAVVVDLRRPVAQRTHLGTFVADVQRRGSGQGLATFTRRLSVDVRAIGASRWTVLMPVVALIVLYFLVWERRGATLLPLGSALRAGAIAALVAGLLGTALEDSGSVVVAMVFVYLGPLMLSRAVEEDQEAGPNRRERIHLRTPLPRLPSPAGLRCP